MMTHENTTAWTACVARALLDIASSRLLLLALVLGRSSQDYSGISVLCLGLLDSSYVLACLGNLGHSEP